MAHPRTNGVDTVGSNDEITQDDDSSFNFLAHETVVVSTHQKTDLRFPSRRREEIRGGSQHTKVSLVIRGTQEGTQIVHAHGTGGRGDRSRRRSGHDSIDARTGTNALHQPGPIANAQGFIVEHFKPGQGSTGQLGPCLALIAGIPRPTSRLRHISNLFVQWGLTATRCLNVRSIFVTLGSTTKTKG